MTTNKVANSKKTYIALRENMHLKTSMNQDTWIAKKEDYVGKPE